MVGKYRPWEKKVFRCMDHLVLRHPSYMRGFTFPFSLSALYYTWHARSVLCRTPAFSLVLLASVWPSLCSLTSNDCQHSCYAKHAGSVLGGTSSVSLVLVASLWPSLCALNSDDCHHSS
jgi:hypothetical protein